MSKEVICVQVNSDLRELARMFVDEKITGAPVVDENGNLVGVVSVTDLVRHQLSGDPEIVFETDYYRQLPQDISFKKGFHLEDYNVVRISEIMTPVLITASEETSVKELAALMIQKHIHRIIITKEKQVLGIVSTLDLLKLIAGPGQSPPEDNRR